ncbi:MAG: PilN domain-containing protein [Synergistaceae bacterium]|jgi:Tfp pilus assembly protein PilN|nr:PilN domain-containing protein [Synergistaceae bacterium]
MKVALDLRPRALIESQKRRIDLPRILLLVSCALFLASGAISLGLSFVSYRSLLTDVARLEGSLELQTIQNARMANELQRLVQVEKLYTDALKLLQEELPALEFMEALERTLPSGVWMRSVSISPGRVSLQGSAVNENDVVEFAKGLLDAPVVATVDFPVTTRVSREGRSLVDFTLSCRIRDFASAALSNGAVEVVAP